MGETSRLLCLDSLVSEVESNLIFRINGSRADICECLDALDFAAANKFEKLLQCLFIYVGRNIDKVVEATRFDSLSEVAMRALLLGNVKALTEDTKFKAFFSWIKKNEIDVSTRTELLKYFDLKKFSCSFISQTVLKTGFFDHEDIISALIENQMDSTELIKKRDNEIKILKEKIDEVEKKKSGRRKFFCEIDNVNFL